MSAAERRCFCGSTSIRYWDESRPWKCNNCGADLHFAKIELVPDLPDPPITPEARADAERYGDVFLSADRSIRLHDSLGITELWAAWELPRRLAVLAQEVNAQQTNP